MRRHARLAPACAALVALACAAGCAARAPARGASPAGAEGAFGQALAARGDWTIEVHAACEVPRRSGLAPSDPARVGGLSGLAYDAGTDTYLAVSDDQETPRVYRFRVRVGEASCTPELVEIHVLTWADPGGPTTRARDFEDLAILPDGSLLLVNEGDAGGAGEAAVTAPGIHLVTAHGLVTGAVPIPDRVRPTAQGGARDNAAFESVAVAPGARRAFVAVEQPLLQDDIPSTFARGSVSRLFEYDRGSDGRYAPAREFALPIAAIPHPGDVEPRGADIGVVAMTALDDTTLLVLERAFIFGVREGGRASRNDILLSRVTLDHADEVSGADSLHGWFGRPVAKQRLLSLADLVGQLPSWLATLDNFEGMALGPRLPDGSQALVLVSDDNFNPAQRTAFVVLRLR